MRLLLIFCRFWRRCGAVIAMALALFAMAMAFVIGMKCADYMFGHLMLDIVCGAILGGFACWCVLEMYQRMNFRMWLDE